MLRERGQLSGNKIRVYYARNMIPTLAITFGVLCVHLQQTLEKSIEYMWLLVSHGIDKKLIFCSYLLGLGY